MPAAATAADVLDREFLEIRARLLDLAAHLDRLDRALGGPPHNDRLATIHKAINLLSQPGPQRAEAIQLLFSRAYDSKWKTAMQIPDL